MKTSPSEVSGLQIAFFILAANLICIPIGKLIAEAVDATWGTATITRIATLLSGAVAMGTFAGTRRCVVRFLNTPIPAERRYEVVGVAFGGILLTLAMVGAAALWHFWFYGESDLRLQLAEQRPHADALAFAFSKSGLLFLLAAVFVAPIIEELVFRGFLYKAWEKRWGWPISATFTSAIFGLYHPHFLVALLQSLILIAILRRTGSLRAPIFVHTVHNLALWYPLVGQFMFPPANAQGGFVSTWAVHLVLLSISIAIVPLYFWIAAKKPAGGLDVERENQIPA